MASKQETKLLRALWRKAFRGEPVEIKLAEKGEQTRVRFALYAAIRPFRAGGGLEDDELRRAAEECSVRVVEGGLEIIRRDMHSTGKALLEALGGEAAAEEARGREVGDNVEPLTGDDALDIRELEKRLSGLETKPSEVSPGARTTPYYTRED